jgi:hypothetical protein
MCQFNTPELREQNEVFEKRALKRTYGSKRDKMPEWWSKLYDDVQNLNSEPDIIMMIISWTMRYGIQHAWGY